MSAGPSSGYRYGPSRGFVWIAGVAVAAQVWWALPNSSASRGTADLERVIYGEIQRERAVSDVRCTRAGDGVINCVATLPDVGRVRVSAREDAASGAVEWTIGAPPGSGL